MTQTTGKLAGRAALITGGGSGSGRGIALRCAREGAAVALCGRREGPLAGVCAEIESAAGRCVPLPGDIGVEADVRRIVAGTAAALGGLDVLVNNASVAGQVGPVEKLDLGRWNEALAVNLGGAMLCCREATPAGRESVHAEGEQVAVRVRVILQDDQVEEPVAQLVAGRGVRRVAGQVALLIGIFGEVK